MTRSSGYAAYDAAPGVRATYLKEVRKSARHLRYMLDNPGAGSTASRTWLQSVHAATLEPEVYAASFAVYPGKTRQGKQYDAWCDTHPGVRSLTVREDVTARAIAGAVRADPVAGPRLVEDGAMPEHFVSWVDEQTGLPCKALIDLWRPASAGVDDLKSVGTTDRRALEGQIIRLGWDVQMAHYLAGVRALYGVEAVASLICVETAAPHDVAVLTFSPLLVEHGERKRREALELLAECKRTGLWPGRYTSPVEVDPPAWDMPSDELGGDDDGLDISIEEVIP